MFRLGELKSREPPDCHWYESNTRPPRYVVPSPEGPGAGSPRPCRKTTPAHCFNVDWDPRRWDWIPAPYRSTGQAFRRYDDVGWRGFHSNHSCRLRPAHQGMKMAPPSPVRVDDSSRGLDTGPVSSTGQAFFRRYDDVGWRGFHSNHSCRLRPAHQGMKMAPPSPVRVDDSSRGLDTGPVSSTGQAFRRYDDVGWRGFHSNDRWRAALIVLPSSLNNYEVGRILDILTGCGNIAAVPSARLASHLRRETWHSTSSY